MSEMLFAGDVLFNRLENGQPTGYRALGNADKLSVKMNSTKVESTSKQKNTYGQVSASAIIPQPAEFGLSLKEQSPENLAMALLGDVSTFSQGSGTMTDQPVTAKLDRFVEIGYKNLVSAGLTVTDSTGTTTYVDGTDYQVNYALGLIKCLSTGSISANEALLIDGNYNAVSASKVRAGTNSIIRGAVMLDGTNLMTGEPVLLTIDEVVMASDAEIDFLSSDPVVTSFSGTMVTQAGKDSPMEILEGIVNS